MLAGRRPRPEPVQPRLPEPGELPLLCGAERPGHVPWRRADPLVSPEAARRARAPPWPTPPRLPSCPAALQMPLTPPPSGAQQRKLRDRAQPLHSLPAPWRLDQTSVPLARGWIRGGLTPYARAADRCSWTSTTTAIRPACLRAWTGWRPPAARRCAALLLPIDAAWPNKCRLRSSIAATADETAPPTPNAFHPSTAATPASAARA